MIQSSRISWARALPLLLFVVLGSWAVTGYRVYQSNQALQLPLLRLWDDPTLYAGDPLAESLKYYVAYAWRCVWVLSRGIGLEPALFLSFLFERVLLLAASWHLAARIFPRVPWAPLAGAIFIALAPQPVVGGGTLVEEYFEHTGLSLAPLLVALAMVERGRPFAWAAFLALGAYCNFLYAAFAGGFSVLMVLGGFRAEARPSRWIGALGLLGLLMIPILAGILRGAAAHSGDPEAWVQVARQRFPHHLFPGRWPVASWARMSLFLTAGVLAGWSRRREFPEAWRWIRVFAVGAVGAVLISMIAAALGSTTVMMFQSARATDFSYLVIGITLAGLLVAGGAIPEPVRRVVVLPALAALALGALSLNEFALVAASLLAAAPPLRRFPWAPPVLLCTGLVITGVFQTALRRDRFESTRDALYRSVPGRLVEAARWAAANTPPEAVFLVDPGDSGLAHFRALSGRPVFVTVKDGSMILTDRSYLGEWATRMKLLGVDPAANYDNADDFLDEAGEKYAALSETDVRRLAAAARIDYMVAPEGTQLPFPVLFESRSHVILDLRSLRK